VKVRMTGTEDECRALTARLPEVADVLEVSRPRDRRESRLVSMSAEVALSERPAGRFVAWSTEDDQARIAAALDRLGERDKVLLLHRLAGYMLAGARCAGERPVSARPARVDAAESRGMTRHEYGPVQLADWLRQFYEHVNVDAARFFGLLPEPDRGGGRRWSAATTEQIRERWPEISAASRCISAFGLKERGWTESMIRDLLGNPDRYVDNPHYSSAAPMRLWRLQRAEALEATPEFAQRRERASRQCAAASKAAETRRIWKALGGA